MASQASRCRIDAHPGASSTVPFTTQGLVTKLTQLFADTYKTRLLRA